MPIIQEVAWTSGKQSERVQKISSPPRFFLALCTLSVLLCADCPGFGFCPLLYNTQHKHPCSRRDSNPHCQQATGRRRPSPKTVRPLGSAGFDPRTVQPGARRYTDWAIPAHQHGPCRKPVPVTSTHAPLRSSSNMPSGSGCICKASAATRQAERAVVSCAHTEKQPVPPALQRATHKPSCIIHTPARAICPVCAWEPVQRWGEGQAERLDRHTDHFSYNSIWQGMIKQRTATTPATRAFNQLRCERSAQGLISRTSRNVSDVGDDVKFLLNALRDGQVLRIAKNCWIAMVGWHSVQHPSKQHWKSRKNSRSLGQHSNLHYMHTYRVTRTFHKNLSRKNLTFP